MRFEVCRAVASVLLRISGAMIRMSKWCSRKTDWFLERMRRIVEKEKEELS